MLAGPILVREWLTTPRRPRFYAMRASYAGLLFVLLWTSWQALVGFDHIPSLGESSRFAALAFELLSMTQLALVVFGGALLGAGSVSIEKERRTFVLLLVTRMSDVEIVLDKFLSATLQLASVLASSLPLFFFLALFGGVSYVQIGEVFAATVGGALASVALGVVIGLWRETTFQSLALTLVGVVAGLLLAELVGSVLGGERLIGGEPVSYWISCVSPVRATLDAFSLSATRPGFVPAAIVQLGVGIVTSVVLLSVGIWKLRSWNPRGEPVQERETATESPDRVSERAERRVWDNPILWREIRTRAYGGRPILLKAAYVVISAVLLWSMWMNPPTQETTQPALAVAWYVVPAIILGLLLVNAQSLASVTTERDLKSLDLLLVTDIAPSEFVYGKIVGAVVNSKEMLVAPLLLLIVATTMGWTNPGGLVLTSAAYLVIAGFAIVLGIHAGLRYESSRSAIANSLGTIFLLFVGVLVCLYLVVISGRFEAQWASFVLFIVLGSIGLWISLSANHPTSAITLAAATMPVATFYCILAFVVGDRFGPFLVLSTAYGFATRAMLVPMLSEFDVATGRTTAEEG